MSKQYFSRTIPPNLYDAYTMNQTIPVYDWFLDGRQHSDHIWTRPYVNSFLAHFTPQNILSGPIHETYDHASWLHVMAIDHHLMHVRHDTVAVIGSESPWVEAILLNMGCRHVTTVDYQKIVCEDPRITTVSCDQFSKGSKEYDAIFSYSSIEHSGLGRYGDELDPEADLKEMDLIYQLLKDDGLVFLGIPVGKDGISWNAHRIYGRKRLQLMFRQFRELDWIGTPREYLDHCEPANNGPQPIIVLKKN